MSEKCDRCGSVGEDRRTLRMACFYDMDELDIPFGKEQVLDQSGAQHLTKVIKREETFSQDKCRGLELSTLRVCKRCRAEWMIAIKAWFTAQPNWHDGDADGPDREPITSGIFIRVYGTNVQISEEEWRRMHPDREPYRIKKENE